MWREALCAVQVRAETVPINLVVTLTGSSVAFNVTLPGMSVVCYELQISDDMHSKMSSSSMAQSDTKA